MAFKNRGTDKQDDAAQKVIEFYEYVGYTRKDKTTIGKLTFNQPWNTILDIPRFMNQTNKFICVHPLKGNKSKPNVVRVFTCYVDFDFEDYDLALANIEKIKEILDHHGFYYGIVHSGRGLHLYLPVGEVGKKEITQLNIHLNEVIFAEFYGNRIVCRRPIKNYSTFLRLPGTINSKSGKKTFIVFQNFEKAVEQSLDYFQHNYRIMLESITEHASKPPTFAITTTDYRKIDYRHGFFKWDLFEIIINGNAPYDVIESIIKAFRAPGEDRELNNYLFVNLAIYIKNRSPNEEDRKRFTGNAKKFIEKISDDLDDPANLGRWMARYDETVGTEDELEFRAKALLNWSAEHFPNTIIHKIIKADSDRLYRHNAYFTFIEENMDGDSVESMRAKWHEFVEENINKPGFHWGILETGIGKTDQFLKLAKSGKRIVIIVPYLMLKFDIEREIGRGSVFTLDSIRGGEKSHKMRQELMLELTDADIVVIDEAHCLDLHYTLKPVIMDELNGVLKQVACQKPVFMLSGTPSVNQILTIDDIDSSKIVSYLRKDLKRIRISVIDQQGLKEVFQKHDRILIFIDDKRQIEVLRDLIQNHLTPEHEIFPVHSGIKTILKKRTEEAIRECQKWAIIGTSSVVSGINIEGLESIVFSNRIMNQQNLYQCMGRLRIVNKLDRIHPIYIMNMTDFKNPRAELDMFEFVSPATIITYLCKLYHVESIVSCELKITSFTRLRNFEEWKKLIKSVPNIKAYFALEQVQSENLYWIPTQIIRELNAEGFYQESPNWFNVPIKSILYMKKDESSEHRAKIEARNYNMGIRNSISHYIDPEELSSFINGNENKTKLMKRFPKAITSLLKIL